MDSGFLGCSLCSFIIFIIVEMGLECGMDFGFLGCSLFSFIIFIIVERGLECDGFWLSGLFIVSLFSSLLKGD